MFLGANPAIRYNLFFFKEKKKRISTAIWARAFVLLKQFVNSLIKAVKNRNHSKKTTEVMTRSLPHVSPTKDEIDYHMYNMKNVLYRDVPCHLSFQ